MRSCVTQAERRAGTYGLDSCLIGRNEVIEEGGEASSSKSRMSASALESEYMRWYVSGRKLEGRWALRTAAICGKEREEGTSSKGPHPPVV